MDGKTIKCPICGEPYKVYAHYVGDQNACPRCQEKATQGMKTWTTNNTAT